MTVRITQWTIDVVDLELMTSFWSAALGYRAEQGDEPFEVLADPEGNEFCVLHP
ncbi:hypothetical protein ACIA8K_05850 [Catenuloplanes sp. NPDC051500]|uniref:hypothetical protein n=1 Tax=Catenuloplanes sp. NPDC051500 TaxID=3363959 RepID=UPI0037B4E0E2